MKQSELAKVQLDEVAILRTFAIIAVVVYHAIWTPYLSITFKINAVETYLNPFYDSALHNWLGARMPLFIFISGYLFSFLLNERGKYASVPQFIKKKFNRLIIPYFVFAFLMGITLGSITVKNFFEGYIHLWFLLMLFWCFVVARLFAFVKRPAWQFVLLVASSLCGLFSATTYLSFDLFIKCFGFFWLGYLVSLHKDKLGFLFETRFIIMLFAVWLACCMYVQNALGHFNIAYRLNPVVLIFTYFSCLSFVLMIYALTCRLLARGIIRVTPWIENFNKCSYGIYVFHLWIMGLVLLRTGVFVQGSPAMDFVRNHPVLFPVILFVIALPLSYLFTKLLLKTSVGRFLIG